MGRRSKLLALPSEVREQLDQEIIRRGFSGYKELAEWIRSLGHETSESGLQRHGKQLERRIEQIRIATDEAKAIEKAVEDDGESIAFATLIQCQVHLHQVALAVETGDVKLACQAARALADLQRTGISLRRERKLGRQEAVKAVDRKLAEAADAAQATDDPREVLRRIREDVYGIFDD